MRPAFTTPTLCGAACLSALAVLAACSLLVSENTPDADLGDPAPVGMVVPFDAASCPAGWAPYAPARGRTIVGLVPGGVPEATVGTPLADQAALQISGVASHAHDAVASQAAGQNSHSHSIPSAEAHAFPAISDEVQEVTGPSDGAASSSTEPAHTHALAFPAFETAETGSAAVEVGMPYLQLLMCQKL